VGLGVGQDWGKEDAALPIDKLGLLMMCDGVAYRYSCIQD
jgi:hypothetical protein